MRLTLTRLAAAAGGTAGGGGGGGGNRLKRLRQLTGRSLLDCRQALAACGHNIDAAVGWLKRSSACGISAQEQPVAAGADDRRRGEKAALKRRQKPARHGLLGVSVLQLPLRLPQQARRQAASPQQSAATAVVVELRCQTEFAARNQLFQLLLSTACQAVMTSVLAADTGSGGALPPAIILSPDRLLSLTVPAAASRDSHRESAAPASSVLTIADALAETASRIGERLTLIRGLAFTAPAGTKLAVYCHPLESWHLQHKQIAKPGSTAPSASIGQGSPLQQQQPPPAPTIFARYAAGVAYQLLAAEQKHRQQQQQAAAEAARRLAQHVVGMRPRCVGIDPTAAATSSAGFNDERRFELQPFLLDETVTAGEWAASRGIRVVDFFRAQSAPPSSIDVSIGSVG
ncbi:hypothetical protein BOX15_Mlig015035g4 [Macrostomum lignano]|uniref:Translation elongation factor EFTs/EF1B dimerisation domain-containing protein n=2 Tax=Macrostomum lignano TaxID=282301 RepID=A0A267FPU9_9PLAT|nr:hypothetical protein BOX15_Mlig015035g4 [Macrostomum lignano]